MFERNARRVRGTAAVVHSAALQLERDGQPRRPNHATASGGRCQEIRSPQSLAWRVFCETGSGEQKENVKRSHTYPMSQSTVSRKYSGIRSISATTRRYQALALGRIPPTAAQDAVGGPRTALDPLPESCPLAYAATSVAQRSTEPENCRNFRRSPTDRRQPRSRAQNNFFADKTDHKFRVKQNNNKAQPTRDHRALSLSHLRCQSARASGMPRLCLEFQTRYQLFSRLTIFGLDPEDVLRNCFDAGFLVIFHSNVATCGTERIDRGTNSKIV